MADLPPNWQRWLLGFFALVLLGGGSGWMTYVQSTLGEIKRDQQGQNEKTAERTTDIAVIKEQIREIRDAIQRSEQNQAVMQRKLDELLQKLK